MTQVAQIIEDAFFEAGLTTELQHATPTQTRRAMDILKTTIEFMYGTSAGEMLSPWPLGNFGRNSDIVEQVPTLQVLQNPPLNVRLVATNEAAITVYLPVDPSPGARFGIADPFNRLATYPVTVDGNGRSVDQAQTQTLDTDGLNALWFFRDDLGDWKKVTPLLITDEMPFPAEYDRMFVLLMAMSLNPVYGRGMDQIQAAILKDMRQQFTARYVQSMPLEINPEITFTSQQGYNNWSRGWYADNTQSWNRGGWWF